MIILLLFSIILFNQLKEYLANNSFKFSGSKNLNNPIFRVVEFQDTVFEFSHLNDTERSISHFS